MQGAYTAAKTKEVIQLRHHI